MRIQGSKLQKQMTRAGVSALQLSEALVEPGFGASDGLRAINNWLAQSDHPRCKPKAIARMAQALGCQPKDLVKFTSKVNHHRGSPRKAGLLAQLIRGKNVDQALNLLTFTTKRAAVNFKKALNAAIADAERFDADVTRLYVCESFVDAGPVIKRFQPKDRGRAHPILKPLSHITVSVEERSSKG